MYQPATRPRPKPSPVSVKPVSPLQGRANASPAVARLQALQLVADAGQAAPLLQLYRTSKQKGQDGEFIPAMTAAIHCHIGRKMRSPHLKIGGDRYNFGAGYEKPRMQQALDALVGDPRNADLEGYKDSVEYLVEQGCVLPEPVDALEGSRDDRPYNAYDDPDTSSFSRSLIEKGLRQGQYPPT